MASDLGNWFAVGEIVSFANRLDTRPMIPRHDYG